MEKSKIIKRLGELEHGFTGGVSEYIEMLDKYLELYDELKEEK